MNEQMRSSIQRMVDLEAERVAELRARYQVTSERKKHREHRGDDRLHAEWMLGMQAFGVGRLLMGDLAHALGWEGELSSGRWSSPGCYGASYGVPAPGWLLEPEYWVAQVLVRCHEPKWELEPGREWIPELEFTFPQLYLEGNLWQFAPDPEDDEWEEPCQVVYLVEDFRHDPGAMTEALTAALKRAFAVFLRTTGFSEAWLSAHPEAAAQAVEQ